MSRSQINVKVILGGSRSLSKVMSYFGLTDWSITYLLTYLLT